MYPTNQIIDSKSLISNVPCDGCTMHHKKCSRNLDQCTNCKRKGMKCTYLIVRKKRGPKTKIESMLEYCESMYTLLNSNPNSNPNPNSNSNSNSNSSQNAIYNDNIINNFNYQGQLPIISTLQSITNPVIYPIIPNNTGFPIPPDQLRQAQSTALQIFETQMNWLPILPQFNPFQANPLYPIYIDPLLFPKQNSNKKDKKQQH